jgi:hypothetical protein
MEIDQELHKNQSEVKERGYTAKIEKAVEASTLPIAKPRHLRPFGGSLFTREDLVFGNRFYERRKDGAVGGNQSGFGIYRLHEWDSHTSLGKVYHLIKPRGSWISWCGANVCW